MSTTRHVRTKRDTVGYAEVTPEQRGEIESREPGVLEACHTQRTASDGRTQCMELVRQIHAEWVTLSWHAYLERDRDLYASHARAALVILDRLKDLEDWGDK
jgi:hypothetical protein